MKHTESNVWVGEKDLTQDPAFLQSLENEFTSLEEAALGGNDRLASLEANRRDFLKVLGFGIGAATLASCEAPVKKAIPFVIKPDSIVPGIANYYASSFVNGGDYCSVLVKTREGRPIKIEGNALSPVTRGGTSARAQAAVLSLYDYNRLKGPSRIQGGNPESIDWASLDQEMREALASAAKVRILSSTIMSPSSLKAVDAFCAKYSGAKHVVYDAVSSSALLDATEVCFGQRVLPEYRFDLADSIVSFRADFLGTWISPIEYAAQYATRRVPRTEGTPMSRHIQFESHMSLTGSNADHRILVRPSEQSAAIAHLYNALATASGRPTQSELSLNEKAKTAIDKMAIQLLQQMGKSLVVAGTNNLGDQMLIYAINDLLGNINQTVRFDRVSYQRKGSDAAVQQLLAEMQAGEVDVLIIWNANPAYELPFAADFSAALAKVKKSVSFNASLDETSIGCQLAAPDHHFLESWGDVEPKSGQFSFIQPSIRPIFDTRDAALSLLKWANVKPAGLDEDFTYLDFLMANWAEKLGSSGTAFQNAWDQLIHDGVFETAVNSKPAACQVDVSMAFSKLAKPGDPAVLEIDFFETVHIGAGQYAGIPWLQELPDPVTRTVWGNYLAVPVSFDGDRRFNALGKVKEDGELVQLTTAHGKVEIGAVKQFGQMQGTLSVALGYGRRNAGDCGTGVGTDFNAYCPMVDGYIQYYSTGASLGDSSRVIEKHFACVQHHHTYGVTAKDAKTGENFNADEAALVDDVFKGFTKGFQGALTDRSVIRHSTLDQLEENTKKLQEERAHHQHLNSHTLYPGHEYLYNAGHQWALHIDLNACIGCGACAVACMAENNVPVVGKREVSRHHEMTWLRIDRYYYGDVEKPNVVYQPMMCQHCNNAPCENVCPVNATSHSSEGLNQMAYNRCVGTRYCANNCPYKVRRFNWYDYTTADLFPVNQFNIAKEQSKPFYADNLVRMVLNPDVTVRARGVIEKCSFCVQRIQEGKLNAKREQRPLSDLDVKSACQTACPTSAITFGDRNNPEGILSGKLKNPLNYLVLEEVNVSPSVNYTMKVNNRDESLNA